MSDYVTKMRAEIKAENRRFLIQVVIAIPVLMGIGGAIGWYLPFFLFQQQPATPQQIVFMPGSIVINIPSTKDR
jgi:hypothetical protein